MSTQRHILVYVLAVFFALLIGVWLLVASSHDTSVYVVFTAVGVIAGVVGLFAVAICKRFKPGNILQPPGARLNRIAEFVFSAKVYERVFKPQYSDVQREYITAVIAGRELKAHWIRLRYAFSFWTAFVLQSGVSVFFGFVRTVYRAK